MPYVETVEDIVEELADKLGIYGAHSDICTEKRPCRVCWVPTMHQRLIDALRNEDLLTEKR